MKILEISGTSGADLIGLQIIPALRQSSLNHRRNHVGIHGAVFLLALTVDTDPDLFFSGGKRKVGRVRGEGERGAGVVVVVVVVQGCHACD